ncbi:MAG: hypothetical protein QNJ90_03785 [Planctomycetota bacterium]|nr:hypothetical protein [Planctomycetota bacterium]
MWLAFAALILWVAFGVLGLLIDLGQARVAQGAMQNAVEGAAAEGLWTTAAGEVGRREAAARLVRSTFDDDFEATADDPFQHGAGGDVVLGPGTGAVDAGAQISLPEPRVYRPVPQTNLVNATHGDMVAGRYVYGAGSPSDPLRIERADYSRDDFTPDLGDPDAFLVRLRRTDNPDGLDAVPGVSSRGRPLPWLFARGGTLAPAARARGIAMRATAIAAARPALAVGAPDDCRSPTRAGAAPFALTVAAWNARSAGDAITLEEDEDGDLLQAATVVGRAIACPTLRAVGEVAVTTGAPPSGPLATGSVFYVPIYDPGLASRIVGFGQVSIVSHEDDELVVRVLPGGVASTNASAVMVDGLVGLDSGVVDALLSAGRGLSEGLRAPALVR